MRKPLDFYNTANHHRQKEKRTSALASGSATFATTMANITKWLDKRKAAFPGELVLQTCCP